MKSIDSILSRLFLTVFVLISCIVTLNAQDDGHTMTVEMNNGTKLSLNTDEVKEVTFADGKIVVSGADLMRTIGHISDSLKLSLYRIDDLERTILDSLITNSYRIENLKDKISSLGDTISRYRTLIEKNRNLIEYNKALIGYYHGFSTEQNHEYVDLGLSVKWATFNVGATWPWEYGDYFAWGEVETKESYEPNNYKFVNGGSAVNDKNTLDIENDVAHKEWGGKWRMPSREEFDELIQNCTWTWTTQKGVNGFLVTSNKPGYTDRSIILPAAGLRSLSELRLSGNIGFYWTTTPSEHFAESACFLYITPGFKSLYESAARNQAHTVRPVCP